MTVVELRTVRMPLVRPFRTSRAVETHRELLLVRWLGASGEGWGECAADPEPVYFPEYLAGARHVIEHVLLPLLPTEDRLTAATARQAMAAVPGNPLAKAALETAVLDAELRAHGMPMADYLGATAGRVPVGVSVGIPESVEQLLAWVGGYLDDGYRRVKLKIEPGWDLEPVRAVRKTFGDALWLQVDANQSYRPHHLATLRALDDAGLLLIEQPFPADDLVAHARLAEALHTPVCLDESIGCVEDVATALELGAARVINIKPGRVGGYLASREIHDLCRAQGVPVWCGGVLETGIGRAANLALAALPGFTLPGDISATSRYYTRDITEPFELRDGHLDVPTGPGSGVAVDEDFLAAVTTDVRTVDTGVGS